MRNKYFRLVLKTWFNKFNKILNLSKIYKNNNILYRKMKYRYIYIYDF